MQVAYIEYQRFLWAPPPPPSFRPLIWGHSLATNVTFKYISHSETMKTISNTFQAPGKRAWFTASCMCAWKFVYWFILFIAYYVAFYTAHTVERLLMNTFVSGMLYLRLPSRNPVFFISNPTQSGQFQLWTPFPCHKGICSRELPL